MNENLSPQPASPQDFLWLLAAAAHDAEIEIGELIQRNIVNEALLAKVLNTPTPLPLVRLEGDVENVARARVRAAPVLARIMLIGDAYAGAVPELEKVPGAMLRRGMH